MLRTEGLHHVTAIAGDPQANLDFYIEVLGLRLVKQTVNFDDPSTYHFYFADGTGSPGTIITFFPWPGGHSGRHGHGQAVSTGFSVALNSLGYWIDRLAAFNIEFEGPFQRFDENFLSFRDPNGLSIEIIETKLVVPHNTWANGSTEPAHALQGLHHVALWEENLEPTAQLLTNYLGYDQINRDGDIFRFSTGKDAPGILIDIVQSPDTAHAKSGVGTVHHIAFRAKDDQEQMSLREQLAQNGMRITPQLDRKYFRSIYFREPGGVLFEVATDNPGFAIDEPPRKLGTKLMLPEEHEANRDAIELALPKIKLSRSSS